MPKKLACPTPLSKALRIARKGSGWTQAELAERAGTVERTVRALERGRGSVGAFQKALGALNLVIACRNAAGTIPDVIRTLRKRRELSQRELARIAGVSQPTIGTLERTGKGQLVPLERVLTTLGAGAYLAPKNQSRAFYSHAGVSSVGQAWTTPKGLLEALYGVLGGFFDLDPCSPRKDGPVKARVRFTAEDDGLSLPWNGRVFVNPPYSRGLKHWVAKARSEYEQGNAKLVVLLIPARTDTSYWHGHVAGRSEVVFLKGRLRFGDAKQAAPFPSALVLYGANGDELTKLRSLF